MRAKDYLWASGLAIFLLVANFAHAECRKVGDNFSCDPPPDSGDGDGGLTTDHANTKAD